MRTILVVLAAAAGLFAFNQNPKLTSLPPNTWMVLDSAGPFDFSASHYYAYSGGTYDRVHHQFLVFGGGHADGWKNDVLIFDIATDTWRSSYTPDPSSDYTCSNVNTATPGMLLNRQRPASRHTYDQIEFMEHIGKMIMWSGPTYSALWSCPGNTIPQDTWLYDPVANTWEYKNVSRQSQPYDEAMCGAYDPVSQLYYALYEGQIWTYKAETDVWAQLSTTGTSNRGYDRALITDRKRQKLWVWPQCYDIKTRAWTTYSGGPSGLDECSYDEAFDALIFVSGGKVYAYDITTAHWDTLSPVNTPDVSVSYQRWFYDPVDNVHLFTSEVSYRPRFFAYRYKGNSNSGLMVQSAARTPEITVSPNPFRSAIRIELQKGSKASIFNANGKLIVSLKSSMEWDASGLPSGVYVLQASLDGRSVSKRLILQK